MAVPTLTLLLILSLPVGTEDSKIQINGDIILGGLFPMHEASGGSEDVDGRHPCGAIKEEKGIQRLEAMLYALDQVNDDPELLPGRTLGALILDTCSRDTHALEQAMDFVKTSLAEDAQQFVCRDGHPPDPPDRRPVAGVIGPASSTESVMVANILRLFRIPQISYASTSTELSDKTRFGFFSRVVPPDSLQARALAAVVRRLGWTYVQTVAVEGEYGEKGIQAFGRAARLQDICIASRERIPRSANESHFDAIVQKLLHHKSARAVVLFVDEDNCRKLLDAVDKAKQGGHFLWVGSDSWGAKSFPVHEREKIARGAITILPKRTPLEGFDRYFRSLTPTNNERNVWFKEFWAKHFNCSFGEFQPICQDNFNLRYEQEGLVPYVVDAVYAMAHALHNLVLDNCTNSPEETCPVIEPKPDGLQLLNYIRNVSFIGPQQRKIRFNAEGDPFGSYDIFQYQKKGSRYDYVPVGEWSETLIFNISKLKWDKDQMTNKFLKLPRSRCSDPCQHGHIRHYNGSRCCWQCVSCRTDEIRINNTCLTCPQGFAPSANMSLCMPQHLEMMLWSSPWAIVPVVISAAGILITFLVAAVFFHFRSTPLVMASGRELCCLLLIGVLFCYATSFVILARPCPISCAVLRLTLGLGLCICYAALLTKTNRLSRIFNREAVSVKRPRFISPSSQVALCGILVAVQLVISVSWIIAEPPRIHHVYPSRSRAVLRCGVSPESLVYSLSYNMALVVLCTIYAIKTRKIPENFNEAKYVGFTMYSTCIIWLAFVPIYFGTNNDYRIQVTSLCVCISLSATVALACLFFPKVYIVLLQPHKNVRQSGSHSSAFGQRAPGRFALGKPSSAIVSQITVTAHPRPPDPGSNGSMSVSSSVDESKVS